MNRNFLMKTLFDEPIRFGTSNIKKYVCLLLNKVVVVLFLLEILTNILHYWNFFCNIIDWTQKRYVTIHLYYTTPIEVVKSIINWFFKSIFWLLNISIHTPIDQSVYGIIFESLTLELRTGVAVHIDYSPICTRRPYLPKWAVRSLTQKQKHCYCPLRVP